MLADQFLESWVMRHIGAGTALADAAKLADQLGQDAAREDVSVEAMEAAAGSNLPEYIKSAIRQAIEEDLL